MADIYGALICPHCLNCIHAVNDPEIGYACPFNPEWGNKYGGKKYATSIIRIKDLSKMMLKHF